MPSFQITGPDGKKYRVTGENAEGALAALKQHLGTPAEAPPAEDQPSTIVDAAKAGAAGIARGAADVVGMPGTIGDALDAGGTWLLRKGYKLATGEEPSPEGGAAERFFAGPTQEMQDKFRFNGGKSIVSGDTVRQAFSDVTDGATDYRGKTRTGKFVGAVGEFLPGAAVAGGMSPSNLARFGVAPAIASEGAGQLTEGTALEPYARVAGALIGPAIPSMAKRVISPLPVSPERAKMAQTLADEGVDLTAGQKTGRDWLRYAESEIGGSKAANFAERQGEQFTGAALKRAGIAADRASPEVMDEAFTRIGNQFDDLAARTPVPLDRQLQDDMLQVVTDYQSVAGTVAPVVERMMNRVAELARQNGGVLAGEAYKNIRSEIGGFVKRSDAPTGMALRDMQGALDDAVERYMSPELMDSWKEVRNQYRNILVLEKAATSAGENAAAGIISPSQLRNATVTTHGRRSYARGRGDFAELARAGEGVMKPLPNSGTAARTAARNLGTGTLSLLGTGGGAAAGGPIGAVVGAILGAGIPTAAGKLMLSNVGRKYLGNQAVRAQPILDKRYGPVVAALIAQALRSNDASQRR